MKKLLLPILLLLSLASLGQVRAITASGVNLQSVSTNTLTNSVTPLLICQDTIKANTLSTYKKVTFKAILAVTSTLTNPTISFKLNFGASSVTVASGITLSLSATSAPVVVEGYIKNRGAANSQFIFVSIRQGSTLVLGLGGNIQLYNGTMAVDTTADQLFNITAQFSTALTGPLLLVNDFEINRDL